MGALLSDKDLLQRLVSFRSVAGAPDSGITDFVCDYLDRRGATVTRAGGDAGKAENVVARSSTCPGSG